jgi:hypothetical protein
MVCPFQIRGIVTLSEKTPSIGHEVSAGIGVYKRDVKPSLVSFEGLPIPGF